MKLDKNGRIVKPAVFRKAFEMNKGDFIILTWKDDELCVTTVKHRIARVQRHVRKYVKPGVSLADELIAERREAAERELD